MLLQELQKRGDLDLAHMTAAGFLSQVFRDHPDRRFIVACFASHIHRVEQVAQAAVGAGRRVAFLGRTTGIRLELTEHWRRRQFACTRRGQRPADESRSGSGS